MADRQLVEKTVLTTLIPPNALNAGFFLELAGQAFVEEIASGKSIFKLGDRDRKTTYLLEGNVELQAEDGRTTRLTGGTDVAMHPIANLQPDCDLVVLVRLGPDLFSCFSGIFTPPPHPHPNRQ